MLIVHPKSSLNADLTSGLSVKGAQGIALFIYVTSNVDIGSIAPMMSRGPKTATIVNVTNRMRPILRALKTMVFCSHFNAYF